MGYKKYIIGLGTGRCGSVSLSKLLTAQTGLNIPHEYRNPLPWIFSQAAVTKRISELQFYNGDVAFYYLNYVKYIHCLYPAAKFICLKREREATVESYMKKSGNRNNWMEHDGRKWEKSPNFYNSYPKFKVGTKQEALGLYYDLYYQEAEKFKRDFPNSFKIFKMEDLNSEKGVYNILHFCGFDEKEMNILTNCHFNKTKSSSYEV